MTTNQGFRDPIFKGATRPAMIFGVPLLAFVLVAGAHLLVGMWLLIFVGPFWFFVTLSAAALELVTLRIISKHDPHRVGQTMLWLTAAYTRRNRQVWNTHSMSPLQYKRRQP